MRDPQAALDRAKRRRARGAALPWRSRRVYNLPQWTLGFATAITLYGERRAAKMTAKK